MKIGTDVKRIASFIVLILLIGVVAFVCVRFILPHLSGQKEEVEANTKCFSVEETIDNIVHAHDDEDYYTGVGGRSNIEAELDYMILKYANGYEPLKEDEYKEDRWDENLPDDGEIDIDWKEKIFQAYKNVDTSAVIRTTKEVTFEEIFEAMDVECRYRTGEDGILIASYSYNTTEYDDHIRWDLQFGYERDVSEIKSIKEQTDSKEDSEYRKLVFSGMSDQEKVSLINEYACDYVEYWETQPYPAISHTPYAALFKKEAVCDGYSRLVKMLCDDADIDCYIVVGEVVNAGGHAWNLVKVDDKWYHLDVTWNDGCGDRSLYYLIPDSYFDKERTWNKSMYPDVSTTPYIR